MDAFLSSPISHIHAPKPDQILTPQLKGEIKPRATMVDESSSIILHSALRSYSLSAAGKLPRSDAVMLTILHQRTVKKLDGNGRLPEELTKAYCDEGFVLHEDEDIIIFGKKTNLSIGSFHMKSTTSYRSGDRF